VTERRPPLWPAYLATFAFWVGTWAAFIAMPLHVVALGGTAAEAGLLAAILPNPRRRSAMQPRPAVRRIAGIVQGRAARARSIDACLKG
jgi:ABC-type xylose transport system permease subunit